MFPSKGHIPVSSNVSLIEHLLSESILKNQINYNKLRLLQ